MNIGKSLIQTWPKFTGFLDDFSKNLSTKESFVQAVAELVSATLDLLPKQLLTANDLLRLEQEINLCLWLWCYQGNKNINFGRMIQAMCLQNHVLDLEGGVRIVLHVAGVTLEPKFSSKNVDVIGVVEKIHTNRSPERALPVSGQFCAHMARLLAVHSSGQSCAATLVRLVRTIQRQVCLVVEHWEFANSVVAVEHGKLLKTRPKANPAVFQLAHQELIEQMAKLRDHEALWCLEAFVEAQSSLFDPRLHLLADNNVDFFAELKATQSLILGALQKVCLPSSVSRHRYCQKVSEEFQLFFSGQLARDPNCVSLKTCQLGFKWMNSSGRKDGELFGLTQSVKLTGHMSFECSHVLKTMAWKLPNDEYLLLVFHYFEFLFSKMEPSPPANHWWELLADTLNMPASFPQTQLQGWYQPDRVQIASHWAAVLNSLGQKLLTRLKSDCLMVSPELVDFLCAKFKGSGD